MAATSVALRLLKIRDFSGGLNLRDAQSELAPNESPDLWNVTLDERGGITKRLGYAKHNSSAYQAALVSNVFYWQTGQNLIVQCGDKLYKDTSTTSFKTFTTSARCGFADFAGKLCIIHPVDGLFTYDGATVAAVGAGPKGDTLVPWQNKLWANDKSGSNPARVNFSAAGDPTSWPPSNFNDLREKDNAQVVCLTGAAGVDIAGRPGLIAFKNRSSYRIYDSTSASYQTIDASIGACGALAVTSLFGRTIVLSERGIFETDGVGSLKSVGTKLEPLWDPAQIAYDHLDLACAGSRGDRVYFSLPRVGASANNLMLEYHPLQGWITAGSNAASCYATYSKNDQKLLSGSPTVNGQVYRQFVGGSDDGTAIASYFQTRWFEPGDGIKVTLRRLRINGRGNFSLYRRKDYENGQGLLRTVTISRGGFTWNAPGSTWNLSGVKWGPTTYASYADPDLFSLGTAKAVSFRIEETSSAVTSAPPLLGSNAPSVGAWGVYGLDLLYVPLGLA